MVYMTLKYGPQRSPRFQSVPMPADACGALSVTVADRLFVTFYRPIAADVDMSDVIPRIEADVKSFKGMDVWHDVFSGHGCFGMARRNQRSSTGYSTYVFLREAVVSNGAGRAVEMSSFSRGFDIVNDQLVPRRAAGVPLNEELTPTTIPIEASRKGDSAVPVVVVSPTVRTLFDSGAENLRLISPSHMIEYFRVPNWNEALDFSSDPIATQAKEPLGPLPEFLRASSGQTVFAPKKKD